MIGAITMLRTLTRLVVYHLPIWQLFLTDSNTNPNFNLSCQSSAWTLVKSIQLAKVGF